MKLFIGFGVCAAWSNPAQAAANKVEYVRAMVVTDGAAVYSKPDFDSPVQDYLGFQTMAIVSKRPYAGNGGMGLFHRIRYGKKWGFIPDTDIKVSKKEAAAERATETAVKKNPSKAFEDEEAKTGAGQNPIYLTRYLGGAVSRVHFTEKFSGHRLSDQMIMYGLRMTGPGTLFDGPPLDFNFWFSLQKPKYFKVFTPEAATGFLFFGDVQAMFPVIDVGNTIANFGLGVMWVYTHYGIPVKGSTTGKIANFDSQELRLGFDVSAGAGHRFGRYLLRGDVKYYFEKTNYAGYVVSFQAEY